MKINFSLIILLYTSTADKSDTVLSNYSSFFDLTFFNIGDFDRDCILVLVFSSRGCFRLLTFGAVGVQAVPERALRRYECDFARAADGVRRES